MQHQNALRRWAHESKHDDVVDALSHIDAAITDCEDLRKTAERKMLKEGVRTAEYADEMKGLTRSIERLKEINIVVENGEIADALHLEDLPVPALEALTKKGRWQIGRKVVGALPAVGILAGAAAYPQTVEAKGFYCGTLQATLEEVPVIEWIMLAGGDRAIPSDEYVRGMANVVRHPAQAYDKVRQAERIVSPAEGGGFFDNIFRILDILLGRF